MKRRISILLTLLMMLSLAACGGGGQTTPTPTPAPQKTKAVQDLEAKIYAIGEVSLESKAAIDEAEKQYCLLNDEERKMVENLEVLILAEVAFDVLRDSELNDELIIGTWQVSQGYLVNKSKKLEIYEAGIAKCIYEDKSWHPTKWTIDGKYLKLEYELAGTTAAFTLEEQDGKLELHSVDGKTVLYKQN